MSTPRVVPVLRPSHAIAEPYVVALCDAFTTVLPRGALERMTAWLRDEGDKEAQPLAVLPEAVPTPAERGALLAPFAGWLAPLTPDTRRKRMRELALFAAHVRSHFYAVPAEATERMAERFGLVQREALRRGEVTLGTYRSRARTAVEATRWLAAQRAPHVAAERAHLGEWQALYEMAAELRARQVAPVVAVA